MEDELREKLTSYAEKFPGYDEYRISGEVLGHDPYVLASALSAIYGEYSLDNVNSELYELFLTYSILSKKRASLRRDTGPKRARDTAKSLTRRLEKAVVEEILLIEVEVAYDYKICVVKLTSKPLESVIDELLTDEQRQIYEILMKTKGNYPDLFN